MQMRALIGFHIFERLPRQQYGQIWRKIKLQVGRSLKEATIPLRQDATPVRPLPYPPVKGTG